MWKALSACSAGMVLVLHTLAFAHGGGVHIMGTVTDMDAQHLVVKTKEGKTQSVQVNAQTTYRKGKAEATSGDLKVGDRVVIHTTGKEDPLTASEIHFSSVGEKKEQEGMTHSATTP